MPETATYTYIDFEDIQVGDRIRFLTRDTGFNGRGLWQRHGVVIRITAKTVVVDCGSALGATAVIRRAAWHERDPQVEVSEPEMPTTVNPMAGEQVTYCGSLTQEHGPAVLLGECVCNGCHLLAEPRYALQLTVSGEVLNHVRLRSFTRGSGGDLTP